MITHKQKTLAYLTLDFFYRKIGTEEFQTNQEQAEILASLIIQADLINEVAALLADQPRVNNDHEDDGA